MAHQPHNAPGVPPSASHDPAPVTVLALDVDGVLTDGSVLLDHEGREIKRFHIRDGVGIRVWQRLGGTVAIITGRESAALRARMDELGVEHVFEGVADKAEALDQLCERLGVEPSRIACVCDDWPDLPLLRRVGYPMAVFDAAPAVRKAAVFVTRAVGGRGAVREAIEHLLKCQGRYEEALALYDTVQDSEKS